MSVGLTSNRRIQALEAQVQNLLRIQDPGRNTQQALPKDLVVPPPPASSTSSPDGDIIDENIVTLESAETLVDLYRTEMMAHFPFIIITPNETGAQLRVEKPFLFLAILTVACFHDLPAQEQLGDRFKTMVTEKVLYGGDDCLKLEYLQGLLVVLAWYVMIGSHEAKMPFLIHTGTSTMGNLSSFPSTSCSPSPLRSI